MHMPAVLGGPALGGYEQSDSSLTPQWRRRRSLLISVCSRWWSLLLLLLLGLLPGPNAGGIQFEKLVNVTTWCVFTSLFRRRLGSVLAGKQEHERGLVPRQDVIPGVFGLSQGALTRARAGDGGGRELRGSFTLLVCLSL